MSKFSDRRAGNPSLWLLILALLALTAGTAHAHQASIARVQLEVDRDHTGANIKLDIDTFDVADTLGLPGPEHVDRAVLSRTGETLLEALQRGLAITADGFTCTAQVGTVALTQSDTVAVSWHVSCPQRITSLGLDYQLFFDEDPRHRALIHLAYGDTAFVNEITSNQRRAHWNLAAPTSGGALSGSMAFLWSGIEHIIFGFDHVAFVLALMMVVVIWRPYRPTPAWRPRSLRLSLRHTAGIVTTFTIAHSLTLIAASLGWIALDGQVVESLIAVSIIYIAVENIIRPDAQSRHIITFAFGLMHGLGFASMLAALLPPTDVILPLLWFNLGVELGQLAIVALVLPLLTVAARHLGADHYRAVLVPFISAALATMGALWLFERLSGTAIIGF